jgi:hypothetical protein
LFLSEPLCSSGGGITVANYKGFPLFSPKHSSRSLLQINIFPAVQQDKAQCSACSKIKYMALLAAKPDLINSDTDNPMYGNL